MDAKFCNLGTVAEIIPGVDSRDAGGGYQYTLFQPNSFTEYGTTSDLQTIRRTETIPEKLILKPGDVLMKRLNPNFVFLMHNAEKASTVSQNLFVIRPGSAISPTYLGYLLEQKDVLSQIEQLSGSAAAIRAISLKKLIDVSIPLLPMDRQRLIGELWLLGKKRKQLLTQFIEENDKLITALYNAAADKRR